MSEKRSKGRPPAVEGETLSNITVRLSTAEVEALDELRRERRPTLPTRSALIREAVQELIRRNAPGR